MDATPVIPPYPRTPEGALRRVGIEIEFHDVEARTAAKLVQTLYGGSIEQVDDYRCKIHDTRLGTFTIELDTSLAHPNETGEDDQGLGTWFKKELAPAIGDIMDIWMPTEISAPPVPFDRLSELQRIVDALRRHGAVGTHGSLLYAFGMHLNPEVPGTDPICILRHLQAYLLLSDWLRAEIQIDPKRRLLPFIDPFPRSYALKVLDPDYSPDLGSLIDDYLDANPTRNRELDMLPLFALLDPDRVAQRLRDAHIKPRPTFHYRLPNSRIDDPGWGVVEEWNRWVTVERLAADETRLRDAGKAYIDHFSAILHTGWADKVRHWIEEPCPAGPGSA